MNNSLLIKPIAKLLAEAIDAARREDYSIALLRLNEVEQARIQTGQPPSTAEVRLIDMLRTRCGSSQQQTTGTTNPRRLSDPEPDDLPGVSVVTCCMNRTENLLNALPTWLAQSKVAEVVIVDWSSKVPVRDSLNDAGIDDKRIRIIRANDEPRWVLSYAFNLGFRFARHEFILKVDADITLRPDFFERNSLTPSTYIAGNWEAAEKGQEHINGFFYVRRADLLRVKGFNEYITTYGWDDDDIYARLIQSGLRRKCVDTKSIYHIPHDNAQRLGSNAQDKANGLDQLAADTLFNIRCNRYIAMVMPHWNKGCVFTPFDVIANSQGYVEVLRASREMPHILSADIKADSEYYAALELVSWRVGPTVYNLNRAAFYALLQRKHLEEISQFDVDVAQIGGSALGNLRRHSLFLQVSDSLSTEEVKLIAQRVNNELRGTEASCFVYGGPAGSADSIVTAIGQVPAIELKRMTRFHTLGEIHPNDIKKLASLVTKKSGARIKLVRAAIRALLGVADSPYIAVPRQKLYIDVQHGLGNRLRAMASAAAIAQATDRELVVVWQPDDHCECRLSDLFAYDGAVIDQSFIKDAVDCKTYNYMTIEGGEKNAPIQIEGSRDIYARSAFVLNSPHSDWANENRFLQTLLPVEAVQSLVASVRHPNDVSAHVRMEAGPGLDHNSHDSPENWQPEDQALIHEWRTKSHFSHFMARLDTLVAVGRAQTIFLAADLPETYREFADRYGDRLAWLPRRVYDRSKEQLHYALADAILLGRAPLMLGSNWSSFSELAIRLAPGAVKVEMSGKDFSK